ncbi:MAG: OFA family MFS transporter, partial [Oscillospiraceae bacterium]|nr:OFA family MFS transporter [Oscillospiraceae bacterium]
LRKFQTNAFASTLAHRPERWLTFSGRVAHHPPESWLRHTGVCSWTGAQANLPFTVMIITFAVVMIPAGWIQDKIGPRKVATAGAITFFIGYSLSGLVHYIPYPGWLIFTYGIIVGLACGLTYSCIAPTARKWYADRPGFAVSVSVMGFGLAAVVFAPLKKTMILALGVDGTFFVLAVFVAVIAFAGARMVKNPPEGYAVTEHRKDSDPKTSGHVTMTENIPPGVFLKTPFFYILWLALAMVIGGGLTAIGLITAYGEVKLNLTPAIAATAISTYSFVNGFGRPLVGYLSDRVGTLKIMFVIYTIQAIVFFALPWVAVNLFMLILCSLFLGLGYAATFGLFPVIVAARCGSKYLGVNYGLVFSAFSIGAITSLAGSWLWDITGSFFPAFFLAGTTSIIGLLLLTVLHIKAGIK